MHCPVATVRDVLVDDDAFVALQERLLKLLCGRTYTLEDHLLNVPLTRYATDIEACAFRPHSQRRPGTRRWV